MRPGGMVRSPSSRWSGAESWRVRSGDGLLRERMVMASREGGLFYLVGSIPGFTKNRQ